MAVDDELDCVRFGDWRKRKEIINLHSIHRKWQIQSPSGTFLMNGHTPLKCGSEPGGSMRTILLICSFLCVAVSRAPVLGQQQLATNHPIAAISYRAAGKLIYVPVQVNGSSPRWFIFDTGAPNSLIDTALAKSLNVSSISSGIIHGAGKGDISASDAGEVKLTLDGLSTRVPHARSWTYRKCHCQQRHTA